MKVTIINTVEITSIVDVEDESKLKPDCVIEDWIKRRLNVDDAQVIQTKFFLHDDAVEPAPAVDVPEDIPLF